MVLSARDIHKSYGPLHILKGVEMSVGRGEIVAIVGKSAAFALSTIRQRQQMRRAGVGMARG